MRTKRKSLVLVNLGFVFLLSGCIDIQVQENRKTDTNLTSNEKISFILDRSTITNIKDALKIEGKIEECIDKYLKELSPPVQTISAQSFRNIAFPGINDFAIPSSLDSISILIKSTTFKERIKPLGLKYLLILGSEYSSKKNAYGFCGGMEGGAGCFLLIKWDDEIKMSAFVIDVDKGIKTGEVKTKAIGHPWLAIVIIFPIGLPAFTESSACNALGKQVATFIVGNRKVQ